TSWPLRGTSLDTHSTTFRPSRPRRLRMAVPSEAGENRAGSTAGGSSEIGTDLGIEVRILAAVYLVIAVTSRAAEHAHRNAVAVPGANAIHTSAPCVRTTDGMRSEERRVGKEWRQVWWRVA